MRRITHQFDLVPQGFCTLKDRNGQSDDCTGCANGLHQWSRWASWLREKLEGTVYRLGTVQAALGTVFNRKNVVIPRQNVASP